MLAKKRFLGGQEAEERYRWLLRTEGSPRNGPLIPSRGSQALLWWRCSRCASSWQASPNARTSMNADCPYCGGRRPWPGVNDLATILPEVIPLWDAANEVPPTALLPFSHRKVRLICPQGHAYERSPAEMLRRGSSCKVCSGRQVVAGVNDLATLHPRLMREWDAAKNALQPTTLRPGSSKQAWWRCAREGHSWQASIKSRVKGAGCPRCSWRVSAEEEEVYAFLKPLMPDLEQSNRRLIAPYEVDIYSAAMGMAVEYNGLVYHSDEALQRRLGIPAQAFHGMKEALAQAKGVSLGFVWADDWRGERARVEEALLAWRASGERPPLLGKLESNGDAKRKREARRCEGDMP